MVTFILDSSSPSLYNLLKSLYLTRRLSSNETTNTLLFL
nr:MAG TPA: hypothetical protein [Caudoviricetes sp.]